MHPANERQRYIVTSSPIGWAHSQNDPWISQQCLSQWLHNEQATSHHLILWCHLVSLGRNELRYTCFVSAYIFWIILESKWNPVIYEKFNFVCWYSGNNRILKNKSLIYTSCIYPEPALQVFKLLYTPISVYLPEAICCFACIRLLTKHVCDGQCRFLFVPITQVHVTNGSWVPRDVHMIRAVSRCILL